MHLLPGPGNDDEGAEAARPIVIDPHSCRAIPVPRQPALTSSASSLAPPRPLFVDQGNARVAKHLRGEFEDLLVENNVDIVLNGHVHTYLRTCAIHNKVSGHSSSSHFPPTKTLLGPCAMTAVTF